MTDALLFYAMMFVIFAPTVLAVIACTLIQKRNNKRWKQLMNALEYERKPRD